MTSTWFVRCALCRRRKILAGPHFDKHTKSILHPEYSDMMRSLSFRALWHFHYGILGLGIALNSAKRLCARFLSLSTQGHLSCFRTSSWAGCALSFCWFPLHELHVYFSSAARLKLSASMAQSPNKLLPCWTCDELPKPSTGMAIPSSRRLCPLLRSLCKQAVSFLHMNAEWAAGSGTHRAN
jgi:hypothetical protein